MGPGSRGDVPRRPPAVFIWAAADVVSPNHFAQKGEETSRVGFYLRGSLSWLAISLDTRKCHQLDQPEGGRGLGSPNWKTVRQGGNGTFNEFVAQFCSKKAKYLPKTGICGRYGGQKNSGAFHRPLVEKTVHWLALLVDPVGFSRVWTGWLSNPSPSACYKSPRLAPADS